MQILRLSNRYELAPIIRNAASFSFVIEVLEEVACTGAAFSYRVDRKDYFRLHPSMFDNSPPDPAHYADEELLVEDLRFDVARRFADDNAALQHAVREIEVAFAVDDDPNAAV